MRGAGWRRGKAFDPGSPSLDPWMPPSLPCRPGAEHTFSRRLAAPESQAFFCVHKFCRIESSVMPAYGRVARSHTRPFGGKLRAVLERCSSARPPL
ncbi:hypothetical protein HMPREF3150_04051 [Pseudomonas aeruginosa]|nr:hypothetical protein HMPREF3150_04051 [Pseudomonas aeruginosa]